MTSIWKGIVCRTITHILQPPSFPPSPLPGCSEPVGACIMLWGQTHCCLQRSTHRFQRAFSPPSWDGLLSPGCHQGCPNGKGVSLLVHFFIDSFCDGHVTILWLPRLNMWQSYDPLYSSVWLRHCSYSSHTHTHTYPHTQLPSFQQQAQKVASGWGTPMATSTQVSRGGAGYQHMLEHDKTLA